ncbi:Protein transport protein yif1, partial [Exophiala xenobiotica]
MQRTPFPPPQKSPELFHPRPQHISQVPMMRSPPPPVPQQASQPQMNSYGNPYQSPPAGSGPPQAGGGGPGFGQSFNFINDPTAQMGFQVGSHAMKAGQEYMEQNLNRYISVSALKHYFNVSNSYVVRKLILVLFPWRHKPWTRQQARMTTSATAADGTMTQ